LSFDLVLLCANTSLVRASAVRNIPCLSQLREGIDGAGGNDSSHYAEEEVSEHHEESAAVLGVLMCMSVVWASGSAAQDKPRADIKDEIEHDMRDVYG
jgi:hypothetical protein